MGRAVFAKTDRIMRKDKNIAQLHQRCHAQRITRVIREGQKRSRLRNKTAVQGHAVGDGGHGKFAHTEINNVARLVTADHLATGPVGKHTAHQVGRTADEFGQFGC